MKSIRSTLLAILAAALLVVGPGCGKGKKSAESDDEPDGGTRTVYPKVRKHQLFNDDWRFTKDDPSGASGLSYEEAKER